MTTARRVERGLELGRRRAGTQYPVGWAIGAGEGAEIAAWPRGRALPTLAGARISLVDRLIAQVSGAA